MTRDKKKELNDKFAANARAAQTHGNAKHVWLVAGTALGLATLGAAATGNAVCAAVGGALALACGFCYLGNHLRQSQLAMNNETITAQLKSRPLQLAPAPAYDL